MTFCKPGGDESWANTFAFTVVLEGFDPVLAAGAGTRAWAMDGNWM